MPERTCSIEGCERKVRGHGWCGVHYRRWYNHGDPLADGRRRGPIIADAKSFWDAHDALGGIPAVPALQSLSDDAFGHWLSGFIDGEGSFGILRAKSGGHSAYRARFFLKLRADDVAVLYAAWERTGLGTLSYSRQRSGAELARPQVVWAVTSKEHCGKLVEMLDRYPLLSKKARDYAFWRQAVILGKTKQQRGRHPEEWDDLAALKEQMQATRAFSDPRPNFSL